MEVQKVAHWERKESGGKGEWHLGLEEGATAAGHESQRLPGPGRICLWDFTSQDKLPPGIRKGEQWGVNGNYTFPFLPRLNGSPSNKNPRERRRPSELGLKLARADTTSILQQSGRQTCSQKHSADTGLLR